MENKYKEFLDAHKLYPTQDNEGFVPDRGSFKCGFYEGWDASRKELKKIINHQSNMESLWIKPHFVTENILQKALQHIHAVMNGDNDLAEKCKSFYWNMEE